MRLNKDQIDFLSTFFKDNIEMIRNNDMLEIDDIKLFIDLYSEYLENSEYKEDDILKRFLLDLKKSLYYETQVKEGIINLELKEMMRRKGRPSSSSINNCKNRVINKWFSESTVSKTISPLDRVELDRGLKPAIKQNHYEHELCDEYVRNKRLGVILSNN